MLFKNKKNLNNLLLLVLGLSTIFYVNSLVLNDFDEIRKITSQLSIVSLLLAILIYFISHIFRVIRLLLLSPDPFISIRELLLEQIKANGVNLMIPFRLGESYRLIVFKKFFNSYTNSFVILVCERLLDIMLIASILIVATLASDMQIDALKPAIMITSFLLLSILTLYFSLDEFLAVIHKIFLSKETTKTTLTIIKYTAKFINIINKTKAVFNSKLPSCILITMVIWSLEILVFYVLFSFLNLDILVIVFLSVCVALSSLLPNGPVGYGGVQLAFYLIGISIGFDDLIFYSFAYNIYIFGTAITIAGLLFLYSFLIAVKK